MKDAPICIFCTQMKITSEVSIPLNSPHTAKDPDNAGAPKSIMSSLINISQVKGLLNNCLCSRKKFMILAVIRYYIPHRIQHCCAPCILPCSITWLKLNINHVHSSCHVLLQEVRLGATF